jgi:hypothetical protein
MVICGAGILCTRVTISEIVDPCSVAELSSISETLYIYIHICINEHQRLSIITLRNKFKLLLLSIFSCSQRTESINQRNSQ